MESNRPVSKAVPEEFDPGGDVDQAFDVVGLAKRAIRGRVKLTLIVAGSLGLLGAIAGYSRSGKTYESSATIHVSADIEGILNESIDKVDKIDDLVERKTIEFENDRVLLMAAEDTRLREVGWPTGEVGARALRNAIATEYKRRKQYFTVVCTTDSEDTPQVALEATIDSFLRFQNEQNGIDRETRELDKLIRQRDAAISNLRSAIAAATAEYGTDDLSSLIENAESNRNELQSDIENLNIEIKYRQGLGSANHSEVVDPEELTAEQLAEHDGQIAELIRQREILRATIKTTLERQGSRHPQVRQLRDQEQTLTYQIEARANTVRNNLAEMVPEIDKSKLSLQELQHQRDIKQEKKALSDQRLRELRSANETISQDKEDLERLRNERSNLAKRKAELNLEQDRIRKGRIEIITAPTTPKQAKDKRPILAGMGFIAGSFFGLAGVIAYGTYKRSFRYVDDLESTTSLPPLLGTLPELEKNDSENERVAAVSVHNLRNTLQAIQGYDNAHSVVIACTSAEPGDGKTTLIQSLGASYALTGLRTILVDLDLVGGGMTARLGLTGKRGVADLLTGLEPTKCIKHTATEKLYALPIGDTTKCGPEQLASRPIQQIIDWLRERFDVILIDTGPVMGSLESGLVASVADQVLLVVARGQADNVVHAAVNRLSRLGVRATGIVFNRADPEDLRHSLSAASMGAPSVHHSARQHRERSLNADASLSKGEIAGSIPQPVEPVPPATPPKGQRIGTLKAEDETGT